MPKPASAPTVQAISSYPAQLPMLNLFTTYTRASYLAAFGVPAPDEDPSRPYKYWFDSTGAAPPSYSYWMKDPNTGVIEYVPIPLADVIVAAVNIPGYAGFPAWVNSPTTPAVAINQATGASNPLNGSELCLQSDAAIVANELLGTVSLGGPTTGDVAYVYNGDPRRQWQISGVPGVEGSMDAAELCAQRWGNGVGSPGSWSTAGGFAKWTPVPISAGGTNQAPPVPVPQRPLQANEMLQNSLLGLPEVVLISASTPAPASGPDVASTLVVINAKLDAIMAAERVPFPQPVSGGGK